MTIGREAQTLFLAAMLFYGLGLVALLFGGVVTTALFFCIAVFCNCGFVQSYAAETIGRAEGVLSARLTHIETQLAEMRSLLSQHTEGESH